MKVNEVKKRVKEIDQEIELKRYELTRKKDLDNYAKQQESQNSRARSITVGTAFGGTTEVIMRGEAGEHLWCVMQPVEVMELIHQLAANVGCHIAIKPRDDFSSWREWRISNAEKQHLNGHPPFVNDMAVFHLLGASGFNQTEAEATMDHWLGQEKYEYANGGATIKQPKKELKNGKDTVAAKKTVNKRTTKRTARAS